MDVEGRVEPVVSLSLLFLSRLFPPLSLSLNAMNTVLPTAHRTWRFTGKPGLGRPAPLAAETLFANIFTEPLVLPPPLHPQPHTVGEQ